MLGELNPKGPKISEMGIRIPIAQLCVAGKPQVIRIPPYSRAILTRCSLQRCRFGAAL